MQRLFVVFNEVVKEAMRLRCHPVRVVRYGLLFVGGLALITGIWQYISGKPHSGIVRLSSPHYL